MLLNIKGIGREDSLAVIDCSFADKRMVDVEGVFWLCNFTPPLGLSWGRAMGLRNRAGVSYSSIANGQRLTSIMVIGLLLAVYIEFWVATGFMAYILYGVFLSSLLKK